MHAVMLDKIGAHINNVIFAVISLLLYGNNVFVTGVASDVPGTVRTVH